MDIRTIYLVANPRKEGAVRALAVVKAWCQTREIAVVQIEGPPRPPREKENALVVALGGDGTVLRAASLFAGTGIPILGANLGSLGFLTQVRASSLTQALERVLRDGYTVENRMRLGYVAGSSGGTVLNDLVIAGPADVRFCELELLWSEGEIATFPGDGLIIATATGSTAYSLSAGGPVIVPPAACVLASPLAAHKLGLRPIVFPAEEVLRVRVHSPVTLFGDGDFLVDLPAEAEVTVERSVHPTPLVRMADAPSFFRLLDQKLNWSDTQRRTGRA